MKLGVVIVTYNRVNLLKECVDACLKQTYEFDSICVVNNNSTDGTKEYLNQLNDPKINIIDLKENLGGSYGFYEGIKFFENKNLDYILLIDDDAIISQDYNKNIVKYMNKNIKNLVGFSGSVTTDGKIQYGHRQFLPNKEKFIKIDSNSDNYIEDYFDYDISTFCGLYVNMDVVKKIGLPEKDFFIWFDDTEYSLRLNKYGKIRNVNSSILNHKTCLSVNQAYSWKSYYGLRNQIYILKKYFGRKELKKFIRNMKKKILLGKLAFKLKRDSYYIEISKLYQKSLNDGMNGKLGKDNKYVPGFQISHNKINNH